MFNTTTVINFNRRKDGIWEVKVKTVILETLKLF